MADGVTPVEEIVRGLDDLARAGKIHYAGLSDFPAWRAARAATMAELRGWIPIAGLQLEYSLVERTPDRELLPMAEGLGMGAALWSPLGGGFLTGKYRRGEVGRLQRMGVLVHGDTTAQKTQILDTVLAVAEELGVEPGQVAIAWLRHRAARSSTSLIPILGANNLAQLESNLGALQVDLSDEQAQRLDRVSAVPLGFPHEALSAEGYGLRIAGGKPSCWRHAARQPRDAPAPGRGATLSAAGPTVDVIEPALAEHRGRLFKLVGDGMLAEFASVVDAVACAVDIQRRNVDGLSLRIAVNLGDIVADGDDVYGDGVNVAARLESIAATGGVVVRAPPGTNCTVSSQSRSRAWASRG